MTDRWQRAQAKEASFWATRQVLESQMVRVRSRYGPVLADVSKHLASDAHILDVGSGPTCAAQFMTVGSKTYLDPLMDQYVATYPGALPRGERICGCGEQIPKPRSSYDVVVSVNALDHMSDPDTALSEIHRVLRADGLLVLGVYLHWPPLAVVRRVVERWLPFAREDAHPFSFTLVGVRRLLTPYFDVEREVVAFRNVSAWIPTVHREDRVFICRKRS